MDLTFVWQLACWVYQWSASVDSASQCVSVGREETDLNRLQCNVPLIYCTLLGA